jgi:hypothetical protein
LTRAVEGKSGRYGLERRAMSRFDVPEADRLEQERVVSAEYDDEDDRSDVESRPRAVPLEAPVDDVIEQRQVVADDDWDDPRT